MNTTASIKSQPTLPATASIKGTPMSTASALDLDVQGLAHIFSHDGHSLLRTEPGSDAWADNAGKVLQELLALGWLPPVYTEAVKREVKRAWEADEDDEAFLALGAAAQVLAVDLVDPQAA